MDLRDWLRDVVDADFGPYAVSTTPSARKDRTQSFVKSTTVNNSVSRNVTYSI